MGTQFANVVTLVVAGEIFAKGLTTIGTVDAVIRVRSILVWAVLA